MFPLSHTHTHTHTHAIYAMVYNTLLCTIHYYVQYITVHTCIYTILCLYCICVCRANSMKDKGELFWRQGDFGYVNDVVKSLMTLCQTKEQVIMHY